MAYRHSQALQLIHTNSKNQIFIIDKNKSLFEWLPQDKKLVQCGQISGEIEIKNCFVKLYDSENTLCPHERSTLDLIQNVGLNAFLHYDSGHNYAYLNDNTLHFGNTSYAESCSVGTLPPILRYRNQKQEAHLLTARSLIFPCRSEKIDLSFEASDFVISDEGIIISSKKDGLYIIEESHARQLYYPGLKLPSDIKRLECAENQLWILSTSGTLYSLDLRRQLLRTYGKNIGDFVIDSWNVLWYIKESTLMSMVNLANDKPPLLYIDDIEGPFQDFDNISIKQGEDVNVILDYCYNPDPDNVVLQYRINDADWLNTGKQCQFLFNEPGLKSIGFRAKASDYNSDIQTIKIRVEQNILQTYWVYVLMVLLLCFLLLSIGLIKARRDRHASQIKRKHLENKLQLLKLEQKMRQAQMNPHFVFNALNSIKGLVSLGDARQSRAAINAFAKIMRYQLNYAEKASISIEEELEYLENYLEFEKMTQANSFDYSIINNLSEASLAPMMIQPFVENAIIHGVSKADHPGQIKLSLNENGRYIKVIIYDNGPGPESGSVGKHKSKATEIFLERCKQMDKWGGGKYYSLLNKPSSDDDEPGTYCILNIPKL